MGVNEWGAASIGVRDEVHGQAAKQIEKLGLTRSDLTRSDQASRWRRSAALASVRERERATGQQVGCLAKPTSVHQDAQWRIQKDGSGEGGVTLRVLPCLLSGGTLCELPTSTAPPRYATEGA